MKKILFNEDYKTQGKRDAAFIVVLFLLMGSVVGLHSCLTTQSPTMQAQKLTLANTNDAMYNRMISSGDYAYTHYGKDYIEMDDMISRICAYDSVRVGGKLCFEADKRARTVLRSNHALHIKAGTFTLDEINAAWRVTGLPLHAVMVQEGKLK